MAIENMFHEGSLRVNPEIGDIYADEDKPVRDDKESGSHRYSNNDNNNYKEGSVIKKIVAGVVVVGAIVIGISSVHIIPTGYTGVKATFGKIDTTPIQSGTMCFTIPFVQQVYRVNNKLQDVSFEGQVWGETSDKTPVYADDITVSMQVQAEASATLIATVSDTSSLVSSPLVASAIKSAMVELSPDKVTERSSIEPLAKEKLQTSIDEKYGENAIYISKIVINDMNFEDAYNEAIQEKSIAAQKAAKQEIENETAIKKAEADKQVLVTNAEAEAEAAKIAAEAEAEANKKIEESISDTLVEYKKIEKWDGKLPTVTGGTPIVSIDTEKSSSAGSASSSADSE